MDANANPFAALSLIAAPAVLTNACSVLVMSTSNRLARAVDRARLLTTQLAPRAGSDEAVEESRLRELHAAEARSLMLVRALRLFYGALGGFAGSAFISLLGALVAARAPGTVELIVEGVAVIAGLVAVSSLVFGCVLLVRETRIAMATLHEQAADVEARLAARRNTET